MCVVFVAQQAIYLSWTLFLVRPHSYHQALEQTETFGLLWPPLKVIGGLQMVVPGKTLRHQHYHQSLATHRTPTSLKPGMAQCLSSMTPSTLQCFGWMVKQRCGCTATPIQWALLLAALLLDQPPQHAAWHSLQHNRQHHSPQVTRYRFNTVIHATMMVSGKCMPVPLPPAISFVQWPTPMVPVKQDRYSLPIPGTTIQTGLQFQHTLCVFTTPPMLDQFLWQVI